jgi:predicted RNA-binding protein with PUA-like domain
MNKWWLNQTEERYWLECTNREDLGADLNAPLYKENGKDYWSYTLLRDLKLGDVIFHYHTEPKAIVGCSVVAGAAFEDRVIWGARGPSAVSKGIRPYERPGLRVSLRDYHVLIEPVTQDLIRARVGLIRQSKERLEARFGSPLYSPIELSTSRPPRVLPGYMFKLPVEYLNVLGLPATEFEAELTQHVSEREIFEQTNAAITGAKAEQHLMSWLPQHRPQWGELIDKTTSVGLGFDFAFTSTDIKVEAKGCRGDIEDLRITKHEWDTAKQLGGSYCLAIVSQLDSETPQVDLLCDPYRKLHDHAVEQKRLQVNYRIRRNSITQYII